MGNRNLSGLKHFRSFRFSFVPEDKIKYELSLGNSATLLHGEHRLVNLSLSGFAFESDQILDPEKDILLKLKLSKKEYFFKGRLVRGTRDRERKNYFIYGVRFSDTKNVDESEFIENLVSHFKHKRLRKELTSLLVNEIKLDDPNPNELLSVIIGLYADFKTFDERGDFLETFMLQTQKLFRCEGVRFYEVLKSKEKVQSIFPFQVVGRRQFDIEKSVFHRVIRTKGPLVFSSISELSEDSFFSTVPKQEGVDLKNALLAPVLDREQNCVGILELFNFQKTLSKQRQLKYVQSVKVVCLILATLYEKFGQTAHLDESTRNHRSSIKVDRNERNLILIGESDPMRSMRAFIQKHKDGDAPILITGGPGTGKELLAKVLHQEGEKLSMPLGVVDVAEWKDDISLSEYFLGSENKVGKFELYSGGTLVLKNIELLSHQMQEDFVSVYESKYAIRLIVTSQLSCEKLEDHLISSMKELLHWSDEGQIELPGLKSRPGDLHLLIDFFLRMECQANGLIDKKLSVEVEEVFKSYHWPGNIRELELALKRCVWAYQGSHVIQELPETVAPLFDKHQGQYKSFRQILDEFTRPLTQKEQEQVLSSFRFQLAGKTLADCGGDAQKARKVLNLTTSQWYEWLEQGPKAA